MSWAKSLYDVGLRASELSDETNLKITLLISWMGLIVQAANTSGKDWSETLHFDELERAVSDNSLVAKIEESVKRIEQTLK